MRILWINGLQRCAPRDTHSHSDPLHGHQELYIFHMYSCEWGDQWWRTGSPMLYVRAPVWELPSLRPRDTTTRESSVGPTLGDSLQHLHHNQRPFFETARDR